MATRKVVGHTLDAGTGTIQAVAFSPDGKILAAGYGQGITRLWDVDTQRQIGEPIATGSDEIDSIEFSPDGKTLLTGSWDGTARLWDVATQQEIGDPLTTNDGAPVIAAFSPDGKAVATAGTLHNPGVSAHLWNISYVTEALPQSLCALAGRSLTRAEWSQVVPSGPGYQEIC